MKKEKERCGGETNCDRRCCSFFSSFFSFFSALCVDKRVRKSEL